MASVPPIPPEPDDVTGKITADSRSVMGAVRGYVSDGERLGRGFVQQSARIGHDSVQELQGF